MSRNNNGKNNNQLNDFLQGNENNAAKLAVIAGIVTTLGDALATMAAVLALEEAQAQGGNGNGSNGVSMDQFKELEKQVRYLTKEMNKLKYPKQ
ncbi:MAG: hypothetical protein ACI33M_08375 [Lysinibacillus sp.]